MRRATTGSPQAVRSPAPASAVGVPRAATARRAQEHAEYHGNAATDLAPIAESPEKTNVVNASHLGSNPAEVIAVAVDPNENADSPTVRRFVVEKEKNISQNGIRSILREGKEIDELNYDIVALQKQGVKLREITAEG